MCPPSPSPSPGRQNGSFSMAGVVADGGCTHVWRDNRGQGVSAGMLAIGNRPLLTQRGQYYGATRVPRRDHDGVCCTPIVLHLLRRRHQLLLGSCIRFIRPLPRGLHARLEHLDPNSVLNCFGRIRGFDMSVCVSAVFDDGAMLCVNKMYSSPTIKEYNCDAAALSTAYGDYDACIWVGES